MERMGVDLHVIWRFLKVGLMVAALATPTTAQKNESFTCPDKCGDVRVPYPFGIGENCSMPPDPVGSFWERNFKLVCNNSGYHPPKLFADDQEVTKITLHPPQLRLMTGIAYRCGNKSEGDETGIDYVIRPFYLSSKDNLHKAFGCNAKSTIEATRNRENSNETCTSSCSSGSQQTNSDSCNGVDCCQTTIPKYGRSYKIKLATIPNHNESNSCSYSFVVQKGKNRFSRPADLEKMSITMKVPIVVDWYVGDWTCEGAKMNPKTYACVHSNTICQNSPRGNGYFCKCQEGYQGNPYFENGCQDIDECSETGICGNGKCINLDGNYKCECRPGTKRDSKMDQFRCVKVFPIWATLLIGFGVGLPFIFAMGLSTSWLLQKRKFKKLREEFFRQNGGLFLQDQISANPNFSFKIFSMAEIEKATNKFDDQMVLGKGGQGIVYKGNLADGRMVAIKRSMVLEERKSKEFANEMIILSQINHVNVVKLLGCCLETEAPILVYEFIPNDTLFHFIHNQRHENPIPWGFRLKIGAESAKAIAYLHSEASPPILHGDIKSSNILLGDDYTAKVSDFGTSTFAPKDKSRFMTLIQGTYGYLDPEYLQTGELTEKSDVYSFGVVMLELLTGRKAIFSDVESTDNNLVSVFKSYMKENRLFEILDHQIMVEEASMEQIRVVADVMVECLSLTGEERPTMSFISAFFDGLRRSERHPWVQENTEEMHSLLSQEATQGIQC